MDKETDETFKTKQINLGNNHISITWDDDDVRTIFFRWFDSNRRALTWLAENHSEVDISNVKIKRSGVYSVRYKWKLVNHKTGDIVLDCRAKSDIPEGTKTIPKMFEKPKEKVYVVYKWKNGLLFQRECTEETRAETEAAVLAEGAEEIRRDEWSFKNSYPESCRRD